MNLSFMASILGNHSALGMMGTAAANGVQYGILPIGMAS
jgi:hypothetical protein